MQPHSQAATGPRCRALLQEQRLLRAELGLLRGALAALQEETEAVAEGDALEETPEVTQELPAHEAEDPRQGEIQYAAEASAVPNEGAAGQPCSSMHAGTGVKEEGAHLLPPAELASSHARESAAEEETLTGGERDITSCPTKAGQTPGDSAAEDIPGEATEVEEDDAPVSHQLADALALFLQAPVRRGRNGDSLVTVFAAATLPP